MKFLIYICILLLSIGISYAQSPQSTLDKFKTQSSQVLELNNAALLKGIQLPNIGESQLGYFQDNGDFKHLYDGKTKRGIHFNAARAHSLNKWDFYGSFDFKTYKEKDVAITAMANPFRDNPYQVADSLSGEWNKQQYSLGAKISAPALLNNRLVLGLDINYKVLTGARQKDPRPLDNSNQLDIAPGLVYNINKRHFLGLNGNYQLYREDLTVELYNNRLTYNIYKLLGLGEYEFSTPVQLSSGTITRRFKGNEWGGSFQYGYKGERFKVLAALGYIRHEEHALDGTTYPKNAGEHIYQDYTGSIAMDWTMARTFHQLIFNWQQRDINNREFHQIQNSTTKEYEVVYSTIFNTALKTRSSLSYLFNKTKDNNELNWTARAGIGYAGLDNRYTTPQSLEIIDKADFSIGFTKYVDMKNATDLSFGINSRYEYAFTDKLEYTDKSYSSNYVAQNIFIPIHQFLAAPSWHNQVNVQYTFPKFANSNSQLYLKGSGYINTAMEASTWINKGSSRQGFQFSVGLYN